MCGSPERGACACVVSRLRAGGGGPAKTGASVRGASRRRGELVEQAKQDAGRCHSDAGGAAAAVGAADPHADDAGAIEAESPAVAETVRRAGLVGDAAGAPGQALRRRHAGEDVDDGIGARAIEQPNLRGRRGSLVDAFDQRRDDAAVGQCRVGGNEAIERDAGAAERDRQARNRMLVEGERQPGRREACGERDRSDLLQRHDRGQIERGLQCVAHGDVARETAVEIVWRVIVEARRLVANEAVRMREQAVEGYAVDERFQGRARRAQGARHVDRAVSFGLTVVPTARSRENFPGAPVGDDGGDVDGARQLVERLPQHALDARLRRRIDRGADRRGRGGGCRGEFLGEVRRETR